MKVRSFREVSIVLTERERALQHQAKEYERRLSDLNHAHDQARADFERFQPRETSEASMKMFNEWRDTHLTEETAYRKHIDESLANINLSIAANTARMTGGKETAGSIRAAILFAIGILSFIGGMMLPLLRRP